MNVGKLLHRRAFISGFAMERPLVAAAACLVLGSGMAACAAAPSYNPDNLAAAQFERVSDICRKVMGLSPKEPLTGGYWLGEPRLDYYTSHYRVCIISLSDSLQRAADAQLTREAEVACRAKGLAPNSSEHALCVLQYVDDRPSSAGTRPSSEGVEASTASPGGKLPQAASSYYYARPREYVHRERLACAALGLEPAHDAFESCVKQIDHALYALDNPIT